MTDNPEPNKNMLIVGINMGVLIAYTFCLRLISPDADSVIGLALIIAIHFVLCMFLANIRKYTKAFLLSAAAVILIGYSTCYIAYGVFH
jgi:hypothetical protein